MRIYLSSTLSDLEPERTAVKQALSGECIVVESYEADPRPLWSSCIADVQSCALYLCIVGLRYGFIPPGQTKSITELEFEAAAAAEIPCLVFMKEASSITVDKADAGTGEHPPELIRGFRQRLASGERHVSRPAVFSTHQDLSERVLKAFLRLRQPDSGTVGRGAEDAAVPTPAVTTTGISDLPAAPEGASELQGLLWCHLHKHWSAVRSDPLFLQSGLLAKFANDECCQALFTYIVGADGKETAGALKRCFLMTGQRANEISRSGVAFDAIFLMALTAVERWIEGDAKVSDLGAALHAPLSGDDPVMVCILAAALFRFGLQFKAGSLLPINVIDVAKRPLAEIGVPSEEGALLIGGEILGLHSRLLYNADETFDRAPSIDTLRRSIDELNKHFGCSVVVAAPCGGGLSKEELRIQLVDDLKRLGARIYFRPEALGEASDEIKSLLDDLRFHLLPMLQSVRPNKPESPPMPKPEASPAKANITNNFTFNAPVGAVAQANAPGAQAAGRDIVNGVFASDLVQALDALRQLVDIHPGLAAIPEKRELCRDQLELLQEKLAKEPRADADAPAVKRYLERLKQGAEAVDNGSTIIEKLTPLWDGLKAAWPAFAVLIS